MIIMYCCCGARRYETEIADEFCTCDWDGWTKVEDGLPDDDGAYLTRYTIMNGDHHLGGNRSELIQEFRLQPRIEKAWGSMRKIHWENEFLEDNLVYAWKPIAEPKDLYEEVKND